MQKRIAHRLPISIGLAAALTIPAVAHANMIANGSFETGPAMPPEGQLQLPPGSTALSGWVVTHAPIKIVWNVLWESAQGACSLALNPTSAGGGIAQTFPTFQGVAYQVQFKMSGEPFTTPNLKWLRVSAAGQHGDFSFDSANNWHWAMGWTPCTWSFTANSSSTTLEFVSLMNTVSSPLIDDVNVGLVTTDVATREPALALALSSANPLRGAATFTFSLPSAGAAVLAVTDVEGRRIATLADGSFSAGPHPAHWAAAGAAPGMYTVTLRSGERTLARRFVLLR